MNIAIIGAHVSHGVDTEEIRTYLARMYAKHAIEPCITGFVRVPFKSFEESKSSKLLGDSLAAFAQAQAILGLEEMQQLLAKPLEVTAFSEADNFRRSVNTLVEYLAQRERDDLKGAARFMVVVE